MLKKKIILSILSVVCCSSIFSMKANAIDSYLIKKSPSTIVQYDSKDIFQSFKSDKKLYKQFCEDKNQYGIFGCCDNDKVTTENQKEELDVSNFKISNALEVNVNVDDNINTDQELDIAKLKLQIKTPKQFEDFLNDSPKFNSLQTPAGLFKFKNTIKVNGIKDNGIFGGSSAYDLSFFTDFNISVFDVATLKLCDRKGARETAELLKQYQIDLYNLATAIFPNQKLVGNFYTKDEAQLKQLPHIPCGFISFYTWGNYDVRHCSYYQESEITEFNWCPEGDSFYFTSRRYNLYD